MWVVFMRSIASSCGTPCSLRRHTDWPEVLQGCRMWMLQESASQGDAPWKLLFEWSLDLAGQRNGFYIWVLCKFFHFPEWDHLLRLIVLPTFWCSHPQLPGIHMTSDIAYIGRRQSNKQAWYQWCKQKRCYLKNHSSHVSFLHMFSSPHCPRQSRWCTRL